ncbi:MAG: hypothetical protein U0235_31800 [Polyangiaceae bacterium]
MKGARDGALGAEELERDEDAARCEDALGLGDPARKIGEVSHPEAADHSREAPILERERERVAHHHFDTRHFVAPQLEHRRGEVGRHDAAGRVLATKEGRQVERSRAGVEERAFGCARELGNCVLAPRAIDPRREDAVEDVVSGSDAIEHRSDGGGFDGHAAASICFKIL